MDDFAGYLRNGSGGGDGDYSRERPQDYNAAQSIDSDRQDIYAANDNPQQILTFAPKERFRLGYFDVMCLVFNRVIGE